MRAIMRVMSGTEATVVFSVGASDQAGSGKSTTMKTILGLVRAAAGTVMFGGEQYAADLPVAEWHGLDLTDHKAIFPHRAYKLARAYTGTISP
jgi:ABC-type branched-subunit amino acid transport system ATPase component